MAALDLRPLSLGELLDRTFSLYRRHFGVFAGITAVPYVIAMGAGAASAIFLLAIPSRTMASEGAQQASTVIGGILVSIVGFAAFVAFLYSSAASVLAVSEIYGGRKPTIRESYRLARGKAARVLGVMIFSVFIVFAGILALVLPGLYLMCRIPTAIPALVVEDVSSSEAMRRSFFLTKGYAGRAAMIVLLAVAITYGVGFLFQLPFFLLAVTSAKQPHMGAVWMVFAQLANLFGAGVVAPIYSIGFSVLYYDLRVRKEALDLQLMMQAIGSDPAPPTAAGGGIPSMFGRDAT